MVDILKNYCIFVLEKRNAKATKQFFTKHFVTKWLNLRNASLLW